MKKLASIVAGLLLLLSTSVFGEEQAKAAMEHAKAAMESGKDGQTALLLEHAKAALEDALAASLIAHGVQKNHLDAGAEELQKAIDHGTLGHVGKATVHAEAAVQHLNAANQ